VRLIGQAIEHRLAQPRIRKHRRPFEELQQIQQFVLLYPRQGEKGPDRAAYVLSKQTLAQQALAKALN